MLVTFLNHYINIGIHIPTYLDLVHSMWIPATSYQKLAAAALTQAVQSTPDISQYFFTSPEQRVILIDSSLRYVVMVLEVTESQYLW